MTGGAELDEIFSNITAGNAVAESVRSTLGPMGMDKMLVDRTGSVTTTNDGSTILHEMDIDNPTAQMVVGIAESQNEAVGDGATTAVTLAGELLTEAEELLELGLHPNMISAGYHLAARRAREGIEAAAVSVDHTDEATLRAIAETALTGTGAEHHKEHLGEIIVDAIGQVAEKTDDGGVEIDREKIDIDTRSGSSAGASEWLRGGIVSKEPRHPGMPTDFDEATILLLNDAIGQEKAEQDAHVSPENVDSAAAFDERQDKKRREHVNVLKELGVDAVFSEKQIDDRSKKLLADAGILGVYRVKKMDLEFLEDVLDCAIVSDILEIDPDHDLGTGRVDWDDEEEYFHIDAGADSAGSTLILSGSSEYVARDLERSVEGALDVLTDTIRDGRVLPGGGAIEVELAQEIRAYSEGLSGREQLAVEAFANAVEVVPRALAENAGVHPIDVLVDLRAAHDRGEQAAGLDVYTGDVRDTFEAGILDPAGMKTHAIDGASEVAALILTIDAVISVKGDQDEDEETPAQGAPGGMSTPG